MSTTVDLLAMRSDSSDAYFDEPGLSNSAMKDLEVSPLRYWFRHINPHRPADDPTPEMQFGSALHCAVLDTPETFDSRYAPRLDPSGIEGCLETIEDIRGWITDKGLKPKGTRKDELIQQAQSLDPDVPILQVIERRYMAQNAGKTMFRPEDWARLTRCVQALQNEPQLAKILKSGGKSEACMSARDPETGVLLKARMDFVTPTVTLDLKTFSQKRGKSIERSIADAIFYESYGRQAYFYDLVRRLATGAGHERIDFIFAFVESEEPHEVRLKAIRPKLAGEVCMLWERARQETRFLIRQFAEYRARFGDRPWRTEQEITTLADEDIPQLAY